MCRCFEKLLVGRVVLNDSEGTDDSLNVQYIDYIFIFCQSSGYTDIKRTNQRPNKVFASSSRRGCRSVVEAVSNSCFLEGIEKPSLKTNLTFKEKSMN
jgi:hypothetical protein